MTGNITFELYRLDNPADVIYTVRSTSLRVALLDGAIAARKAALPFWEGSFNMDVKGVRYHGKNNCRFHQRKH